MKKSLAVTAVCAALALVPTLGSTPAQAAGTTYHVATTGSDANPGTSTKPFRTVQKAVDAASAGSTILLHKGTYAGQVKIRKSGSASAPIRLTDAGDGAVTLTHTPRTAACDSRQPAPDRTIMVSGGADYWTIEGLTIDNGIHIFGKNGHAAYQWFTGHVNRSDYKPRRDIPGRGKNDPVAARNAISYLSSKTGKPIDPSDGIVIKDNTITGRGVHAATARYGTIAGNHIYDIDCGTGPGIWLITFSDGWTVENNHIHDVKASAAAHFMQEGVRLGSASNYNVVRNNLVEKLSGDGRGFNTDVDSSYNTFEGNTARDVAVGYNDQMSGWGNRWIRNTVTNYRTYGFSFRLMDGSFAKPSLHSSTNGAIVSCNSATGAGKDLGVGASRNSIFTGNTFSPVMISKNAKVYWGAEGNRWNGSTVAPTDSTPFNLTGC